ncbi:glycosyltransferase [Microcella humidisoli]|uniref:Glycosyltransferase n=1 Tax=Microcella humidisoli TaxID=2963406 RepID=A0ABY5FXG9_9MICO|nr:glycosyltransferase [Microcella humidisoli]UTT63000.1 glycosyltransferase [Microcella humidisoli]
MSVHVDLRCLQDPTHPERGIPTYTAQLAVATEAARAHRDLLWVLSADGPVPRGARDLLHSGRVVRDDDHAVRDGADVLHITSPFYGLPARIEPAPARYRATVATLYDLIPLRYPEVYLSSRHMVAAYRSRLELVRQADRVLSISRATTRDAIDLAGIDPGRIVTIGAGVSADHVPASDPSVAYDGARAALPDVRPGFVLYTGGWDFRKNLEGLLQGYAQLPRALRAQHQLVIVCSLQPQQREHLEHIARDLGVIDDFLLTGYVSDAVLIALYQSTALFVFPSLFEGFGLPVAEALACGAPCIVADTSSLVEIVPDPAGRFDPGDARSIADRMAAALTPGALRDDLLELAATQRYSWHDVAGRTLQAYDEAAPRRRAPLAARPRCRIALVSPMPPVASGVADYSARLLPELARHADVDVFAQAGADPIEVEGVRCFAAAALPAVRAAQGEYDDIVYSIGNSEYHYEVFAQARRHRGGTALLHDVALQGVLRLARTRRPDIVDVDALIALEALEAGDLVIEHAGYPAHRSPDYADLNRPLVRSIARRVDRLLVHSRFAASLARLELAPGDRADVQTVAFAHRTMPAPAEGPRDAVVSMGILSSVKQSVEVWEAFLLAATRHPHLVFALVGENHLDQQTLDRLQERARTTGVAGRVIATGRVSDAQYNAWLARAMVAVQLRATSRGESSAAVADCFAAGVPVIVSALGSALELPPGSVVRIPVTTRPDRIAAEIDDVISDPIRRQTLGSAARSHAVAHDFARAARDILIAGGADLSGVVSRTG